MSKTYTIEVMRTSVEKSGQRGGRAWTLYKLEDWRWVGTQPAFVKPNVPFTTFDALSGEVEVTVEEYKDKSGALVNYSIEKAGKARRNGGRPTPGGDQSNLEARVRQLESEVADLRTKFEAAIRAFGEEDARG